MKYPSGWYKSEDGSVFHVLTDGGVSEETLKLLGKMADAARKMQAADDAVAYRAMADDPTVDQAAWRELAEAAELGMKGDPSDNMRCSACGAEARWRVCPRCRGVGCTSEDCPCHACEGEGGEWVCDCDEA